MTTLTNEMHAAWRERAQRLLVEIQAHEKAPAFFSQEVVQRTREQYHRAVHMANKWRD